MRLQTLGAATILIGDTRMQASAGTMFSVLLRVGYAPGMVVDRDELIASLWPEYEDLRRKANLRQALYKLRGYGVRISMNGNVVQADDAQFVRTFSLIRTTDAFDRDVTLGHEPFGIFLPGFVVPWTHFQQWIDEQREAIHADVRRVLVEQLRRRRDRADWGGAEALARNLLQFDSLNEEATLTIAECTALAGSKSEAIAILDRYLADLGPLAGEIRLPATLLKRRIAEPSPRARLSFAPTERHFVGRDAELAELTLAMRRARWHDGNAILLHGTAGIGKSRLAHELSKVAEIEGVRVTQASCREGDLERTLSLFLELVPELLGLSGALGCAPDSMAALRRLVPLERGVTGGENLSQLPPREPMPSALTLRRAIVDLLSAVSDEKPMLLIIEDVHWIDEHSWEVLTDLIDRLSSMRVFVLMTSREPHARPVRPQRVSPALMVKRVPALSAEHCVELSRAIGEDLAAPVTEELSEWFVRACEGNPLFLRSLVNHWIETGEAGGVPPTLHGVIELRLSQLSGEALRVLQTATLLEKWATVERVVRVLELRASEMLQSIEQLEAMGALSAQAGSLLVAHELVAKAARARMSGLGLRAMHRRVGEALLLESKASVDADMFVEALRFLHESGDRQALEFETLAGLDLLIQVPLPSHGLNAIARLSGRQLSSDEQARRVGAEARLMLISGAFEKALALTLGTVALPPLDAISTDAEADIALTLIDATSKAGANADRPQLIAYAVGIAENQRLSRPTKLRAADIGLIMMANNADRESANRIFQCTLVTKEEALTSDIAGRVAILYHTIFGDREIARPIANFLLGRAKSNPNAADSYQDAMRAGFALRFVDDGDQFIEAQTLAYDISINAMAPMNAMNSAFLLGHAFADRGDRASYLKWSNEVRRLSGLVQEPLAGNFANALFCRVGIEENDAEAANRALAEYVAHSPQTPHLKAMAYASALSTAVQLLDKSWIPSQIYLQELREQHVQVEAFGTMDFTVSTSVEAHLRAGRREDAGEILRTYLVQRRELSKPSARLRSLVEILFEGEKA